MGYQTSMNILITGGLGYLGGRLGQWLAHQGYCIYLGTRACRPPPSWLPQAKVIEMDWDSKSNLQHACKGMQMIIHAAGMNAQHCVSHTDEALHFKHAGTNNLIEAARVNQVQRMLYLSSAHVYASPLIGRITEQTQANNEHPYAKSHRLAEQSLLKAVEDHSIEGLVLRLSNAYGAPMDKTVNCWSLLVNDLCRQAVTQETIHLHSSGVQSRDFIPIQAVCRVVEHLLKLPLSALTKPIVNVGGLWAPTVWDMACLIQERCQAVLNIHPKLSRPVEQLHEKHEALHYELNVLKQTEFHSTPRYIEEIDELLTFCKMAFA